ncbi:hypothetical protein TSUD_27600 [Trifolium subterraneum]|uniref:Reverse transcriptase zinc-binding domain-containing protein n=1 Tax=Trifolium subterraneum TaxID=3900 RepID=A0A2Z6PIA4_TRISU|nr:hypothetical protein TSUD_27600 [Trifolium subterraneum]
MLAVDMPWECVGCVGKVIVEDIKVLSWKWCLARMKLSPCLFYEWTWDPGECLLR